ncbi:MAG: hypothetical protein U5N85_02375 [Arcicella sp.]|nr:hypothetical protein [Arcicella sp.]
MRLVTKDLNNKPEIFKKQSTIDDWENIASTGDVSKIKDDVYKGSYKDANGKTQSRVREKLNEFYFSKCAYCELLCKAEIEHYRPKKGVTEDTLHNGYYWLCYEWSNLVPSCRYCNTEGGKGNQFPIKGTRVKLPTFDTQSKLDQEHIKANTAFLLSEQPYLLHPEIDNPVNYLNFKIDLQGEGIEIIGTDGVNERGEQTIKICNLNRQNLKLARKQNVIDEIIDAINAYFELWASNYLSIENLPKALLLAFQEITEKSKNIELEHHLLRNCIVKDEISFNKLIISQLQENKQAIVQAAFRQYQQTL